MHNGKAPRHRWAKAEDYIFLHMFPESLFHLTGVMSANEELQQEDINRLCESLL